LFPELTTDDEIERGEPLAPSGSSKRKLSEPPGVAPWSLKVHFSAIFVSYGAKPDVLLSHLPQMVAAAALAHPRLPKTRLVQLPEGSEARLCQSLSMPGVSVIGVLSGAPYSKSLVDLVIENVPEIELPCLDEKFQTRYLPVKINTIEMPEKPSKS
jgi:hypothetical protein